MKQRNTSNKTIAKQSNQRTMLTITVIAVLVVVAAALIWNNVQSRSNDVIASNGMQSPTIGATKPNATPQRITPAQYQSTFAQPKKKHLLVDVRTPEEFAGGHIPGAINISLQTLPQRMNELPKDETIVLYCRSGNRSNTAAQMMARAGYSDLYDLGGIIAWSAAGLPVQ